jgi:hypothetical protein
MPIGRKFWCWSEPRLRSGSTGMKIGIGALLVCGAFVYTFFGPLVFDASYWVFGKIARVQADRRLRVGVSVAFVLVYIAALSASGSTGHKPSAAGSTSTPFVAANASASTSDTSLPSLTAFASANATVSTSGAGASPGASSADTDDEAAASAGASFAPDATGIVPPTNAGGSADRLPGEPDPSLTPGALNPAVTQATIHSTICVSGWTATIRPSESFTNALKVEQIGQYGYSDTKTSSYEEDHLIPLELGGAPADPRNLWPEPYTIALADGRPTGARTKDPFETKLKTEVCAGTLTLAQAQSEIGDNWVHAYYAIVFSPASASPTTGTTPAPTVAPTPAPPAGTPTPVPGTRRGAVCKDGTTSDATGSGACSQHRGVDHWLYW